MFRSAIVKLTVWYVALVMGLSLLFSVVLYHITTQELDEALHHQYHQLMDNDHDADNAYPDKISAQEVKLSSEDYLQDLAFFNVAVLIGATIVSYALAKRTLRPIEIAHRAQARFTAEASHELRTPLAAMRADTEATLIGSKRSAETLRRTMQDNLKDIEKLENLTEHLLALSRYQGQTLQVHEPVDLDGIIQAAMKQFRRRLHARQLVVTTDVQPLQILGDPQGLSQVATIIMDNAIKYSERGGKVEIGLHQVSDYAVVTVSDTGIGISPEDLPHIFERFYRSRQARLMKSKTPGFGLGLSLAYDIVASHRGLISITSDERIGTTVTIKLPMA